MKMEISLYSSEFLLDGFPPILRQQFKEMFTEEKIGICPITLNDITPTKHFTYKNSTYSYHFTLRIPYAGKTLLWEIIFDPEDLTFAPDFDFNDNSFILSTELETVRKNLPSLLNWNVKNSKQLTSVIKECLALYKKQQLEKLQQNNIYSQLNNEFQALIKEISLDNVELLIDNNCVNILVYFLVDTNCLPEYLQPMKNGEVLNPGDDACILKISFLKLDASKVNSALQLSARLDQIIDSRYFQIPLFLKSMSLLEYLNAVVTTVQEELQKVEECFKLKKEFITTMCTMFPSNIIEFDAETFCDIELLCEVENYFFRICIELGDSFPSQKPSVVAKCVHCLSSKKTCTEKISNYRYNAKWSVEAMIKTLMDFLSNNVPKLGHK